MATTLSTKGFLPEPRGSFASATGAHFLLAMGPAAPTPPSWNSSFLSGSPLSGQLVSPALSLPRSEFPVGNIPTPGRWESLRFGALNKLVSVRMEDLNFPLLPPLDCKLLQNRNLPRLPPALPTTASTGLGSHLKPDLWAADENLANILANQGKFCTAAVPSSGWC